MSNPPMSPTEVHGDLQARPVALPVPEPGRKEAEAYVAAHFKGLYLEGGKSRRRVDDDAVVSSSTIRGGQRAADAALADLDLNGYASTVDNAYPVAARGSTGLSPYIRHGLLDLPRVWAATEAQLATGVSEADVTRYRTELLWQDYSRHCYAAGAEPSHSSSPHSSSPHSSSTTGPYPLAVSGVPGWDQSMGCLELPWEELEEEGHLVGQARRWLASDWVNRRGLDRRRGEDIFFAHLLDGSRAANRLQWATVAGSDGEGRYLFSRWDVEVRAPGLCASCERVDDCPVEHPYQVAEVAEVAEVADLAGASRVQRYRVQRDDASGYGGPPHPERPEGSQRRPDVVWITAESLGDDDPALAACPELPVVFVFDRRLLHRLQVSSKRLVFLVETLADLATRRHVNVWLGDPTRVLTNADVSVTWTPVPGWRRLSRRVRPVETHPWHWLRQPARRGDSSGCTNPLGLAEGFDQWCHRVAGFVPEQVVTSTVPAVLGDLIGIDKVG